MTRCVVRRSTRRRSPPRHRMIFERSDREFIDAGQDAAKRDALLCRLRRERNHLFLIGIAFCVIIFALGGWALVILSHNVQLLMHLDVGSNDKAMAGIDRDLHLAKLITLIIALMMLNLPWGIA